MFSHKHSGLCYCNARNFTCSTIRTTIYTSNFKINLIFMCPLDPRNIDKPLMFEVEII